MKRNLIFSCLLTLTICATAFGRNVTKNAPVQVTVELTDGSRLEGKPSDSVLPLKLDYGKVNIPFDQIQKCEVLHRDNRITVSLQNGDKLTGTPDVRQFKLETLLGKLAPEFALIERVTFATAEKHLAAAEKGAIAFDGVEWLPWKTMFEVKDGKLLTVPAARPGFNYGHAGSGRGPTLMSNIGNSDWKDYRIDVDYCVTGVDPSFNQYQLPSDYHDGVIFFHVADARENWNQRGSSMYALEVQGNGNWGLKCFYNAYCKVPEGYGNPVNDGERLLATGEGLKIDRERGNKFRIEVRGQNIKIWVDDAQIADVTDEQMDEKVAGQTLDHGGVGFHWGLDAMGWISNFSYRPL